MAEETASCEEKVTPCSRDIECKSTAVTAAGTKTETTTTTPMALIGIFVPQKEESNERKEQPEG